MRDTTLGKIVAMFRPTAPAALRRAALTLAGHVGASSDRALVEGLIGVLDDTDSELRVLAITALGQLKAEAALPRLEGFARHGGPELEAAVQAASQIGARGARLMSKVLEEAHPFLRARIAGVLAKSGTGNALVVSGHALLDPDPKVAQAAARSLAAEAPSFSPAQKSALAKFLLDTLQEDRGLSPETEVGLLRVLGVLHDERAEEICWKRLAPHLPSAVRVAALQALGGKAQPGGDARLQALLTCAGDREFEIVATALTLLRDVPVVKKQTRLWLKLMDAPDVAARRFAIAKLRGLGTQEWARALAAQVDHADRGFRDEALAELGSFPAGRDVLLDRLLESAHPDACWLLSRALGGLKVSLSDAQKQRVFAQALAWQSASDRRAPALWSFLREVDHDWARDRIEEQALALRKKKKFPEALELYRLLAHDPACGEETRFELAAVSLRVSQHDLAADARQNDPALHQFARLLQNPAFDLMGRLKKAKWLEPEDLFYLGFHFIEQTHRHREFGIAVLELVVEREPKSEVGKNARRKLKSEAAN